MSGDRHSVANRRASLIYLADTWDFTATRGTTELILSGLVSDLRADDAELLGKFYSLITERARRGWDSYNDVLVEELLGWLLGEEL